VGIACLPLTTGGGCTGRTACFQYTQGEYAANGNQCPAPKDALPEFTDPKCPGPVVAVNGPGTFDGEICCYPVTYEDIVSDCGNNKGAGGQGGSFTSPPSGCSNSCNMSLQDGTTPCNGMVAATLGELTNCANLQCSVDCGTFTVGHPLDASCTMCLEVNCSSQLINCQND
jgi:hypothetical protein